MDRLSTVITTALAASAAACGPSGTGGPAPSRSRVDAVQAAAPVQLDPKEFCEAWHEPDAAPALALPKLRGEAPATSGRSRWINVWATWCKPCVEEMPRLAKWREKLGGKYELSFVSVDENEADLAAFRKDHPDTPASPRLAEPAKQADWYVSLGLDGGAPVPIHIFVEPSGHVRCARAGGVREQDFAAIEKLFSQ